MSFPSVYTDREADLVLQASESDAGVDMAHILHKVPSLNPKKLMDIINQLLRADTLELLKTADGKLLYRTVARETAEKLAALAGDEKVVYQCIKAMDVEGIWIKSIKTKTELHQAVVTKCLKTLEQKRLIKPFKSIKFPTRKMYMLYELDPTVEATGGPWYNGQSELDTEFIENLSRQCYRFIQSLSFPAANERALYPSSHVGYPTIHEIMRFLSQTRMISGAGKELSHDDIALLLETLVLDGKIKKVTEFGCGQICYRAARREKPRRKGQLHLVPNGGADMGRLWTDIPCGRCPVEGQCADGGLVNPRDCEYMQKWLFEIIDKRMLTQIRQDEAVSLEWKRR